MNESSERHLKLSRIFMIKKLSIFLIKEILAAITQEQRLLPLRGTRSQSCKKAKIP